MDQSYGEGSLGRAQRSLSTSAPVPTPQVDNDGMTETDVQMTQPPPNEAEANNAMHACQVSPRRCEAAVRPPSPGSSSSSSCPSSDSGRSSRSTSASSRSSVSRRSSRRSTHHNCPLEPPVTRSTLSELDVSKIIHNPKLRHDINFDPELHFRPNMDGEKGRKKQDRANQFWRALTEQLAEFIAQPAQFYQKHGATNDWTLPELLKAVKDIILTLVPQRDRPLVEEGLNLELLMQQFYKGVADLEKLAQWLSRVLKSHCAPMRDDWVDTMYTQLSNGNRNDDLDELVSGMRSLLSVLEAMKLDVANHQIRCLRPILIEDTTQFEQKFFMRKIHSGKVDVDQARQWYLDASTLAGDATSSNLGDMGLFFGALTRMVMPSTAERRLPSTFLFDEERIMKLRSDMVDAVNLEVCMRMHDDLERVGRLSNNLLGACRSLERSPKSKRCSADFDFNTPPSTSRPSSLVLSQDNSASSSARSSLVLPSYLTPDSGESRTNSRNLYNSLIALLQSATPTSRPYARWTELAPSMAMQVLHFSGAPLEMLEAFEEKLTENVCGTSSQLFLEIEESVRRRLMTELAARVGSFKDLSGVALFAKATGSRPSTNGLGASMTRETDSPSRDGQTGGIEDIVTRLAHLGIVHWRVWGPLVYHYVDMSEQGLANQI
ncbi:hypothetical protein CDD81_3230 [Ophiocordyceps australis]|uniref:Uncharacterized protein n=1 Tax=Ophiocordyceps australis TaxID=1399860 RepID=A0A2C5X7B0_9HYPO|nr:hypothetical protein CDD81_3230 [Ophiocordyceps australis]